MEESGCVDDLKELLADAAGMGDESSEPMPHDGAADGVVPDSSDSDYVDYHGDVSSDDDVGACDPESTASDVPKDLPAALKTLDGCVNSKTVQQTLGLKIGMSWTVSFVGTPPTYIGRIYQVAAKLVYAQCHSHDGHGHSCRLKLQWNGTYHELQAIEATLCRWLASGTILSHADHVDESRKLLKEHGDRRKAEKAAAPSGSSSSKG